MKSTLLLDRAERTFVVVFDKGEEVVEGLTMFAGRESLRASQITAIGALSDVTLGYFDRDRKGLAAHGGPVDRDDDAFEHHFVIGPTVSSSGRIRAK